MSGHECGRFAGPRVERAESVCEVTLNPRRKWEKRKGSRRRCGVRGRACACARSPRKCEAESESCQCVSYIVDLLERRMCVARREGPTCRSRAALLPAHHAARNCTSQKCTPTRTEMSHAHRTARTCPSPHGTRQTNTRPPHWSDVCQLSSCPQRTTDLKRRHVPVSHQDLA